MAVKPDARRSSSAPSVDEIRRIVAIESAVVRNLEITYCYSRLAAASASRIGEGANWCTYATWASRQAGGSIRGEDLLAALERMLAGGRWILHPVATLWRKLLRRGLFQRGTRLGRLMSELHTPFDAFELASDVVARGNLKVFEEIGLQFARYLETGHPSGLRPGDPPEGQRLLSQAFAHYEEARLANDPARHAQLALLANLEIGLHEQTRLQPEILEALDAASTTQATGPTSARRAAPPASRWWRGCEARPPPRWASPLSDPAGFEQARARGDHRRADGAGPARRLLLSAPTSATRTRRSWRSRLIRTERATGDSSRFRPPSTTAARTTGRTSTSGCTTSCICSESSI
jgi:hypothetical protein